MTSARLCSLSSPLFLHCPAHALSCWLLASPSAHSCLSVSSLPLCVSHFLYNLVLLSHGHLSLLNLHYSLRQEIAFWGFSSLFNAVKLSARQRPCWPMTSTAEKWAVEGRMINFLSWVLFISIFHNMVYVFVTKSTPNLYYLSQIYFLKMFIILHYQQLHVCPVWVLYVFCMAQSSVCVRWSLLVCPESVFSPPHLMCLLDCAHILLETYRGGAILWFVGSSSYSLWCWAEGSRFCLFPHWSPAVA